MHETMLVIYIARQGNLFLGGRIGFPRKAGVRRREIYSRNPASRSPATILSIVDVPNGSASTTF
jgi:hypothetical protein